MERRPPASYARRVRSAMRRDDYAPQQFLYFLPLPQGQGLFRPTFWAATAGRFLAGSSSSPWEAAVGVATCFFSGTRSALTRISAETVASWMLWTISSNIS